MVHDVIIKTRVLKHSLFLDHTSMSHHFQTIICQCSSFIKHNSLDHARHLEPSRRNAKDLMLTKASDGIDDT